MNPSIAHCPNQPLFGKFVFLRTAAASESFGLDRRIWKPTLRGRSICPETRINLNEICAKIVGMTVSNCSTVLPGRFRRTNGSTRVGIMAGTGTLWKIQVVCNCVTRHTRKHANVPPKGTFCTHPLPEAICEPPMKRRKRRKRPPSRPKFLSPLALKEKQIDALLGLVDLPCPKPKSSQKCFSGSFAPLPLTKREKPKNKHRRKRIRIINKPVLSWAELWNQLLSTRNSQINFKTWYRDLYLKSELWKQIRIAVFQRDGQLCQICKKHASQVHHKSYSHKTLQGKNLENLISICRTCHENIEFQNGIKLSLQEANQKIQKLTQK